jgi:pyridoxal phosphate enzyme (YggS family)
LAIRPGDSGRPSGCAPMPDLRGNIERVRASIADAAARAGRDPASVTLVGVSKTQPAELVAEAIVLGIEHVGENRVQEADGKVERVHELLGRAPTWHLIGTLQRNKVRQALDLFDMIQSIDSVRLAEALASRVAGEPMPVLLEVYFGDDTERPGFRPGEIAEAAERIVALPSLEVRGLMTVAPFGSNAEQSRAVFRQLRELRDRLREGPLGLPLTELSMGMTDDFGLAIEEGATIVRVGRAIFGERS